MVIKLVPLFQPLVLQPQHQQLGSETNMKEMIILYPKHTKTREELTDPKYQSYLCLLTSPTRYRSNLTADLGSKTPPTVFWSKKQAQISYAGSAQWHQVYWG